MRILRIFNSAGEKLHILKMQDVMKATYIHKFRGKDVLNLMLPINNKAVYYLQKNCFIVDENDNPFIIKYVHQENEKAEIFAYSPHFIFERRITRPAQGAAILSSTGSADKIVKDFIKDCIPGSGARNVNIVCAPNQDGTSITEQTRRHVLADKVISILKAAGRGEKFTWDNGQIIFDTYAGLDRTKGNADGNAECVFAARFKNLEQASYKLDSTIEQTTSYVGGAGEGTSREIYVEGDTVSGWERSEVFVDGRDIEAGDTDTLTSRASQAIITPTVNIKAVAKNNVNLTYGVDYNVGDVVTVQVPYKSYTTDEDGYFIPLDMIASFCLQISEVKITYENNKETVDVVFGDEADKEVTSTNTRVAQLEASGASNGDVKGASSSVDGNIVVFDGTTGKVIKDSGLSVDGWISANETWIYASSTTITVPSDATKRYRKGGFIKLVQDGATKYFNVVGVSSTLLTVTGGSDYSVASSAITGIYYAAFRPVDFPAFFNWTPTHTGFSTPPSGGKAIFFVDGDAIEFNYQPSTNGTSNGSGYTFTLPVRASSVMGDVLGVMGLIINNSTSQTTAGRWAIAPGNNYVSCFVDMYTGGWATSNGKRVRCGGRYYI
jgi:hypothetical protein